MFRVFVGVFFSISFGLYAATAAVALATEGRSPASSSTPLFRALPVSFGFSLLRPSFAASTGSSITVAGDEGRNVGDFSPSTAGGASAARGGARGQVGILGESPRRLVSEAGDKRLPFGDGPDYGSGMDRLAEERGAACSAYAAMQWDAAIEPGAVSMLTLSPGVVGAASDSTAEASAVSTVAEGGISRAAPLGGAGGVARTAQEIWHATIEKAVAVGSRSARKASLGKAVVLAELTTLDPFIAPTEKHALQTPSWFVYFDQLYKHRQLKGRIISSAGGRFIFQLKGPSSEVAGIRAAFCNGLAIFLKRNPLVDIEGLDSSLIPPK